MAELTAGGCSVVCCQWSVVRGPLSVVRGPLFTSFQPSAIGLWPTTTRLLRSKLKPEGF
jgi:hypothetical protein